MLVRRNERRNLKQPHPFLRKNTRDKMLVPQSRENPRCHSRKKSRLEIIIIAHFTESRIDLLAPYICRYEPKRPDETTAATAVSCFYIAAKW